MSISTPFHTTRRHVGALRLLTILTLLLLATVSALAQPITPDAKEKVLKGMQDYITQRAYVPGVDFEKWPAFLAKHHDGIEKATDIAAFSNELNKTLREFGFSHIRLLTPRAATARNSSSTVGVGIASRKVDKGLEILSIVEDGPAQNSGLDIGDTIIEVEGKFPDSTDVLSNQDGSRVDVKVEKKDGHIEFLSLERRQYTTVRPETLTWFDKDTAVLRIPTFANGYSMTNVEKLLAEASKGKYLILDLRSNGGGAVTNMRHLLNLLMPDGSQIGTSVSRGMATRYAAETKGDTKDPVAIAKWAATPMKTIKRALPPFSGKIAVLVNRGSASASEITAAALRENLKSPLVGTKSAGAVLVSIFAPLPEGFQLQYPTSDYITGQGMRLEAHPLVPDVEVTPSPRGQSDATIAKAAATLQGTATAAKTAEKNAGN
jgi:carboxyl-terminal processing protease